jgi:hypothetical protein
VIRCTHRVALAIVLILVASAAFAQELDIFEITDFMDPRLRGLEFDNAGRDAIEHGSDFKIVRAVAGAARDYDWRTKPTGRDVQFVHITGSYYSGLMQGSIRLTTLNTPSDSSLPHYRLTTEVARYLLDTVQIPGSRLTQKMAERFLLTTSVEQTNVCKTGNDRGTSEQTQNVCHGHVDYEIGAQYDTSIPLGANRGSATGSLIVAFRISAEQGRIFRATYVGRVVDLGFDRMRVGVAYDVSAERASSSLRWGATRVSLLYAVDLAAGTAVNVAWTPTFILTEPGRRVHNEVALFIDRKLYSKIIPHPPSRARVLK